MHNDLYSDTTSTKHCFKLNKVFVVIPTLNFQRDIASIKKHFQSSLKNNGWYLLYDHEVLSYLHGHILPLFNDEMSVLYSTSSASESGIPGPLQKFIPY
jgi:hypothetical protein